MLRGRFKISEAEEGKNRFEGSFGSAFVGLYRFVTRLVCRLLMFPSTAQQDLMRPPAAGLC